MNPTDTFTLFTKAARRDGIFEMRVAYRE